MKKEKNVLILSTGSDSSTSSVIEWLNFYDVGFYRINYPEDIITFIKSDADSIFISVNQEIVDINNFDAFWYRKGVLKIENFKKNNRNLQVNDTSDMGKRISYHIEHEQDDLIRFIYNEFAREKKAFSTSDNVDVNKLIALKVAKMNGIDIPSYQVVTTKEMVTEFSKSHSKIITKPISGYHLTLTTDNQSRYMTFTTLISRDHLEKIPSKFLPSLIQEYIEKKYEIRSFYFLGKFYSMAIFSQQTDQTSVDFRKYSRETPNRVVPFKLPVEIESKLKKVMSILGLNTGSIDLIYTLDSKFVFLEVNPVGQFGMVSYPCNYQIEQKIAKYFKS